MKNHSLYFSLASLLVLIGLATGCQTLGGVFYRSNANQRAGIVRATKFTDNTLFWTHFDATKRSSIISTDSLGHAIVLAEVTPDAALQKTLEVLGKASVAGKVDAETQIKTASTIAQLGQRTANVNMLRDALYRIAEGANNHPNVFYFFGTPPAASPTITIPAPPATVSAPGTTGAGTIQVTNPAIPAAGTSPDTNCSNCGTMYERLFMATLYTYRTAVQAEAEKARADADKAKSEAEKAKIEAAAGKEKDKPGASTGATPKPATSADSAVTNTITLKMDMSAKTAPVKKKIKSEKAKVKE